MLDYNNYCIGKLENLKDIFIVSYVIVDEFYKEFIPNKVKERRNISQSNLSDSEIITISIVGELFTIDSESAWFNFVKNNFKDLFPKMCDRSRFNRTKKNLYTVIREIQSKLFFLNKFLDDSIRIVDSMPIPVCKFARSHFSKCFKDISEYGHYASKKETYFGLKFHALITTNGYITDFLLTVANVDDRNALWELTSPYKHIKVIGDKGYISDSPAKELANECGISLLALQRKNSKKEVSKSFRNFLSKIRRRVETSFSQLAGQLNISRVLAKSKLGLMTRITLKVLAHNLAYLLNFLIGETEKEGQIKHLIFG